MFITTCFMWLLTSTIIRQTAGWQQMCRKTAKYRVLYQKQNSGFVQQLVQLVHAGCVELVPLVDGGQLRLEHDGVFLGKAKSTGIGGGVVGGVLLDDLPPDVVLPPLVLQFPHVARQGGGNPLVAVLHIGLVAAVSLLPGRLGDAHVQLLHL